MTDDLRARIAAALRDAAHYCDGDCGKTETECDAEHPIQVAVWHFGEVADVTGPVDALADAVLAVVQAEADQAVRGVQGWMALNLHTALGRPVDHAAAHQGHDSWADWWADLCAEVRSRHQCDRGIKPEQQAAMVDDHPYIGTPTFGQRCQDGPVSGTCGGLFEQHMKREHCYHLDPKRLGTRLGDLALICACGAQVFPGLRTTADNSPTSKDAVDNPGEQR